MKYEGERGVKNDSEIFRMRNEKEEFTAREKAGRL
jgi:hypothetical protein